MVGMLLGKGVTMNENIVDNTLTAGRSENTIMLHLKQRADIEAKGLGGSRALI